MKKVPFAVKGLVAIMVGLAMWLRTRAYLLRRQESASPRTRLWLRSDSMPGTGWRNILTEYMSACKLACRPQRVGGE